jgi:hypothetical protein
VRHLNHVHHVNRYVAAFSFLGKRIGVSEAHRLFIYLVALDRYHYARELGFSVVPCKYVMSQFSFSFLARRHGSLNTGD